MGTKAAMVVCPVCHAYFPSADLVAHKQHERTCRHCDKYFESSQPSAKYCSKTCKASAYNAGRRKQS